MSYRIVPITEGHIEGFRAVVDSVAREHRFLALLEAPPLEATREFVCTNLREGSPQFVAEAEGSVVGWCDVVRSTRPVFRHSGVLGMGLIAQYRGRGIGRALLETTVEAAERLGITRIELTVRVDNRRAISLYEALGFVTEGRLRHHMLVEGEYHESLLMARITGIP